MPGAACHWQRFAAFIARRGAAAGGRFAERRSARAERVGAHGACHASAARQSVHRAIPGAVPVMNSKNVFDERGAKVRLDDISAEPPEDVTREKAEKRLL